MPSPFNVVHCGIVSPSLSSSSINTVSNDYEPSLNLDIVDFVQSWKILQTIKQIEQVHHQQDDKCCYFHSNEPVKDQKLISSSLVLNNSDYNEALEMFQLPITTILTTTKNENATTPNIPSISKKKRKISSSSFKYYTSPNTEKISISSNTSPSCIDNSNSKHLKRRRKHQKRKNSAYSNPAQTQMEFNFPIWTFHME